MPASTDSARTPGGHRTLARRLTPATAALAIVSSLLIGLPVAVASESPSSAAAGSGSAQRHAASFDPQTVDSIVQSEMSAIGIPGVAVAVVQGDDFVYRSAERREGLTRRS